MKSLFSLLLAILILAAFFGFGVFSCSISSGAEFERKDKKEETEDAPE